MGTRTAIISDLHSNVEALTAVLRDIEARGVSEIVCLGDIVGYGPEPEPCIDLVIDMCSWCLMGNHDEAVLHGAFGFNEAAREAIEYTRRRIKPTLLSLSKRKRWSFLAKLREYERRGPDLFFHASPREPTTEYILPQDAQGPGSTKLQSIFGMIDRLVFIGHTHIPGVITEDFEFVTPELLGGRYVIEGSKAIVNVGSVGQPRDGIAEACYVIVDQEASGLGEIVWHRVGYDVETTMAKIRATGQLHERLAARLVEGR